MVLRDKLGGMHCSRHPVLAREYYLRVKLLLKLVMSPALLIVSRFLLFWTLLFGLLSFPKWQSWALFAIVGYALYWLFLNKTCMLLLKGGNPFGSETL
jgi:hypothetical protein